MNPSSWRPWGGKGGGGSAIEIRIRADIGAVRFVDGVRVTVQRLLAGAAEGWHEVSGLTERPWAFTAHSADACPRTSPATCSGYGVRYITARRA